MQVQARQPARRAFTLLETIAAIVILAVALPPMLWAMRAAHIQRVNPVMASKARWLATEKLEDIVADRHSRDASRGYGYLIAANYPGENPVAGFPGFSRSVTFVETGPDLVTAGTGYKRATVNIGWTDATGTARTLSIATVLTEY